MAKKQQVQQTPEEALADAEQNAQSEAEATQTPEVKPAPAVSTFKFKKIKNVAVQMFKSEPNVTRYFLIDGPHFKGKEVAKATMGAPDILPVTDLETGEQGQFIIGKVLLELLHENYPDHAYVGKKFQVTPRKRADKKYNTYDFAEIETED